MRQHRGVFEREVNLAFLSFTSKVLLDKVAIAIPPLFRGEWRGLVGSIKLPKKTRGDVPSYMATNKAVRGKMR